MVEWSLFSINLALSCSDFSIASRFRSWRVQAHKAFSPTRWNAKNLPHRSVCSCESVSIELILLVASIFRLSSRICSWRIQFLTNDMDLQVRFSIKSLPYGP
jgi:hypothetical protein